MKQGLSDVQERLVEDNKFRVELEKRCSTKEKGVVSDLPAAI